ncbi:hypothetical protein ACFYVL_04070 [Streptomyces sp. NPDC004111]|uniref:hypothetical protein n=1 Tax=Streptomyces sp. NPDC004111 TaxID=3364690 RepID=UPI0036B12D84
MHNAPDRHRESGAWLTRAEHRADVLAGPAAPRALAGRSAPADRSDAAYAPGERTRRLGSTYFRGGPYRADRD